MASLNKYSQENHGKSQRKVELILNALMKNYQQNELFKLSFEKLLQAESDINDKIQDNYDKPTNLLHVVHELPQSDLRHEFNLLLNYGVDFTYKDSTNQTVVHKIVREFVKQKFYPFCSNFRHYYVDSILSAHVKFNNFSNPSDDNGFTHFHAACITDNAEAVKFFLKNGVDVDLTINKNSNLYPSFTPLHLAVYYNCTKAVEILMKFGADIHLKSSTSYSTLHSIIEGKIEKTYNRMDYVKNYHEDILNICLKFFIDDDRDAADLDEFGFCKLHAACLLEDTSIAESLLACITNINQAVNSESPIFSGYTAFHFAATCNIKIFELLVKNGADIGVKNASGLTPFDLLLHNCSAEQIRTIFSMKPEWEDIILSDGKTKLVEVISGMENIWALFKKNKSASKIYVPFDSPLYPGYTLLHLAVAYVKNTRMLTHSRPYLDSPIVQCLEAGADMTVKNANGSTPLHLAFYLQEKNILQYLLNNHTLSINPIDDVKLSHFHIACAEQHVQLVEHFLSKKTADVNIPVLSTFKCKRTYEDHFFFIVPGSTALHISVTSREKKITKMLLKHGADVNAQDVNGFTSVHRLLSSSADADLNGLLLSHENLKNITATCGLSHLHIAAYLGHNDAIIKLLERGADINAPAKYGKCDWIVKESSNISIDPYGIPGRPLAFLSKHAGWTPLHFPKYSQHETRLLLIERGADVFAKNDAGICPLETLLTHVDNHDGYLKMINANTALRTYLENEYGISKLHIACFLADVQLVRNSIKEGANVNAKVRSRSPIWQGYAPLHCTVKRLLKERDEQGVVDKLKLVVQFLIKNGADILLRNDDNDTPFHVIRHSEFIYREKFFPFMSILFEHLTDFNVNQVNNDGISLFHIAFLMQDVGLIRKFLDSNVDINQPIRLLYFCTPLNLIILWLRHSEQEELLQILDMLLERGADVNATGFSRTHTPLLDSLGINSLLLRPKIIGKLIRRNVKDFLNSAFSHGAEVNAKDPRYEHTIFECLLRHERNATWKDIKLFSKVAPNFIFNMYSPKSQEGYLAIFFRYHRDVVGLRSIMDKPIVLQILNHPGITEITNSGRTVIHNIVCLEPSSTSVKPVLMYQSGRRRFCGLYTSKPSFKKQTAEQYLFYKDMIEQLLIRGCDIDHQDNEGKTALHLAMEFGNHFAVIELLRNGADINVTDNDGKTAYYYCSDRTRQGSNFHGRTDVITAYSKHVHKLKICGLYVNEHDAALLESLDQTMDQFYDEIKKMKSMTIGNTALNLYKFLMNEDLSNVYMSMTNEERRETDQFFENIDKRDLPEISCILKLKYKESTERKSLLKLALTSLNVLIENQLPDLCARMVLEFLNNNDLKKLIAAVN